MYKFEIKNQRTLVVTDEGTGEKLLQEPCASVYFNLDALEKGKIEIRPLNDRKIVIKSFDLDSSINAENNQIFTKETFETFSSTYLGANFNNPQEGGTTQEGANLYDKLDTANNNNGWLNNLNVSTTHVSATHTKYFSLTPNQDYWYLNAYGASTSFCIVDEDFNIVRAITGTVEGTFTAASSGEAYVRFTVRDPSTFMFAKGNAVGDYKPYVSPGSDYNPFEDKIILAFGDSIVSEPNGWPEITENIIKPKSFYNYAISGQKIAHRLGTSVTTNPPIDAHDDNVFSNSIEKWKAEHPNIKPHAILIALGTNDISQASTIGTFADAYANDVDTIDQTITAAAFRKSIHHLQDIYPATQIFYLTPVQSKTGGRNWTTITNVGDVLSEISGRMNVNVIDVTRESGVSDEFENVSAPGRHTYDGTHLTSSNPAKPNGAEHDNPDVKLGSEMVGTYVAQRFKEMFVLNR